MPAADPPVPAPRTLLQAVAFGGDQFVKLLDLVADMNVARVLLQRAGIFDRDEHGWFPWAGWIGRA